VAKKKNEEAVEQTVNPLEERVAKLEGVVAELTKFWNEVKENPYIKKPKGGLI